MFEINTCPLCKKELTVRKIAGVDVYECPTRFVWNPPAGIRDMTHYEVEMDSKESIQHMYVKPYAIDNYGNNNKSRIYKIYSRDTIESWRFIVEVPQIKPDLSANLLNRIQKLVMFL